MTSINRPIRFRQLSQALERAALISVLLLASTFAFEWMQPLVSLKAMVLTNVEIVMFLTVGLWLLACLAARRWPRVPESVALPTLIWLVVLLISAMFAPSHRMEAFKFVARVLGGVFVGWAVYDLAFSIQRWRMLLRTLVLGGIAVALIGLAEAAGFNFVQNILQGFKSAPTVTGDILRISATLSYATIASMVLELIAPLLLAWLVITPRLWTRMFLGFALLAALAAQVLTLTRSGVIALLAAVILMGAWAFWQRQQRLLMGVSATVASMVLLIAVVFLANPLTRLRLASETEQLWYKADYRAPEGLTAEAGQIMKVPLTLTNSGVRTWQATGPNPFRLSYRLSRPDDTLIEFDAPRTPLPHDVPPGASVEVFAQLATPPVEGNYFIEWDMLQEDITWFSFKGTAPLQTRLTVVASRESGTKPSAPSGLGSSPPIEALQAPGRLDLWRTAARMIQAQPLLGVGPDNFRWVYGIYAGLDNWDTRYHTNNLYIEWLVNTGILGLLAFLWLSWRLALTVYHRLAEALNVQASPVFSDLVIWRLGLVGSLTAWYVHGIFDNFYEFTPTYLAFWMIVGLALRPLPVSLNES